MTANEGKLRYVIGDATQPKIFAKGTICPVIVHSCNDIGAWGAGFTNALSKRWPNVEAEYRNLKKYKLGKVHMVQADSTGIWVANLIGQCGIVSKHGLSPVRYWAIWSGLESLCKRLNASYHSIHMPRIGCGLGGGAWYAIEEIVAKTLVKSGYDVTIYDLKKQPNTVYAE